jgi:hypothetical protein
MYSKFSLCIPLFIMALSGCNTQQYQQYQGSDFAELVVINKAATTTNVFAVDTSTCPNPKRAVVAHLEGNSTWTGSKGSEEFKTPPLRISANMPFHFLVVTGGTASCTVMGSFMPKSLEAYSLQMDSEGEHCILSLKNLKQGVETPEKSFTPVRGKYFQDLC